MKHLPRHVLLSSLFILISISTVHADRGIGLVEKIVNEEQNTRTALIIGNSSYETSPLKNPANDASDMADVLRKSGFEVTLKVNASLRDMDDAIRDFGQKLNKGGVGLFYYAGHGIQVKGRNYLIPVDARIETESDVRYESVDAGRILGKMQDAANDLNIIILDACRNNPYARSFRSAEKGLAQMDAPSGSILAYSTSPGSVAADGRGKNGLYTSKLLKHIGTPGLTIERVFKNTRIDVQKESGESQTPWESSSLTGDFYFVHGEKTITDMAPPSEEKQEQSLDAEEEFWRVIKNSSSREHFESYLESYPTGRFAPIAQIKLDQLQEKVPAAQENIQLAMITPQEKREDSFSKAQGQLADKDVVVIDEKNDVMWQKYTEEKTFLYNDAVKYCENLVLGGFHDWSLPSSYKLNKLVDDDYSPTIDPKKFPGAKKAKYWTSTIPLSGKQNRNEVVNFETGQISYLNNGNGMYGYSNQGSSGFDSYVRCYRKLD